MSEHIIPSYEQFLDDVRKIYPDGTDLPKAYNRIVWYIENETMRSDGSPVTYKIIMDKFAAHIRSWNIQYGSRDPKFRGKDAEEKRKNIWDFVGSRWYEREFSISAGSNERDTYLFGPFTKKYLKEQLDKFNKTLKYDPEESIAKEE